MGIDVTLVETGRLPADQIGSTAFALSNQSPIALSEIEQTKARDLWLSYGGLGGSRQRTLRSEESSADTARRCKRLWSASPAAL